MEVDGSSERPAEAQEGQVNGVVENGESHVKEQSQQQPRRRVKLKYEQYRIIANSIVSYMRQEEEKDGMVLICNNQNFV